ncbi:MAG: hypothetical protein APR63_07970 [Desulfuromonas sp. SDB]|nr:MAG: hypothetical protein APR63_07970 [Desulfuromonas sp. SDB]
MQSADNRTWISYFYQQLKTTASFNVAAEQLVKAAKKCSAFKGLSLIIYNQNNPEIVNSFGSLQNIKNINDLSSTDIINIDFPDLSGYILAELPKRSNARYYLWSAVFLLSLFKDMRSQVKQAELSGIIDQTTGLLCRNFIFEEIDFVIKQLNRYGGEFSLLLIAVDKYYSNSNQFANFDDHSIQELKEVAGFLKTIIRETDRIASFAPGAFLLLLSQTDLNGSNVVCSRILEMYRRKNLPSTISIGIANYPADSITRDELLEVAEKAVNHARGLGGNTAARI